MSSEPTPPAPAPAIAVSGLSKAYFVYAQPRDRLRQAIAPRLRRAFGLLGLRLRERTFYTEHWALRDLSFEVAHGETVAIIGRNGSGKSTLLQLVCGTLTPTTGEVRLQGRVAALLELGSGFNPEYTGRENILLNASVLGLSQEETKARMDQILAFADIGDVLDQPVKTYSSGMAMRLAFAVIAHVDADVLVIDEALAVGDAMFQQKCFRWLRDFQKRGTVLFCGHDMGAVMNFCERAIWLDRGRVRMAGTAKDVAEAYTAYTGAQAMGLAAPEPPTAAAADAAPPAVDDIGAGWVPVAEGPALGTGAVRISHLRLVAAGRPGAVRLLSGGEELALEYRLEARADVDDLLFGLIIADRLGQQLLAAGTSRLQPRPVLRLAAGNAAVCRLSFRLPHLHTGTYVFSVAVASGTQDNHVQHHWAQDALSFEVASRVDLGALLTVPVTKAELVPAGAAY
jgi:lipopolysaccharide transport system ATP-binding protein